MIRLVVDNLNTHSPAALYATFSPTEAHRIARKLEFHYTPKNSSWLNMAELEFSALARQCLDRRIADTVALRTHTDARTLARNAARATVIWRFTMTNARIRLIRLYPA